MSSPVAKEGDSVVGVDTHLVIPEGGGTPVATPLPFQGRLDTSLSADVLAENLPVAVVGSVATQSPGHIVAPKSFAKPPANRATVVRGSGTVLVNNVALARAGDIAETCNDPVDLPVGAIQAQSTVLAGG
jgi:uncharacterized Zn-binding protein involved in type VI secretion